MMTIKGNHVADIQLQADMNFCICGMPWKVEIGPGTLQIWQLHSGTGYANKTLFKDC